MVWMKLSCLILYAMAIAGWTGAWSGEHAAIAEAVAAMILVAHAGEVLFAFKVVRLYRGPLAMSIVLTLLFGLLHLRPLQRQERVGGLK